MTCLLLLFTLSACRFRLLKPVFVWRSRVKLLPWSTAFHFARAFRVAFWREFMHKWSERVCQHYTFNSTHTNSEDVMINCAIEDEKTKVWKNQLMMDVEEGWETPISVEYPNFDPSGLQSENDMTWQWKQGREARSDVWCLAKQQSKIRGLANPDLGLA